MESARAAREGDIDTVVALSGRIRDELGQGRGGPLFLAREAWSATPRERLVEALGRDDVVFVVGCYDEPVFGYALASVEILGDGTRIGVIEDLAVEPEMRAVGIGEAMMDLLIEHLRAAGCRGVDAWALPGDRETKNFFESFGLKARLLVVHRSLEE